MPQYIILDKNTDTDCFRLNIPENATVTGYRISSNRVCDNGLANRELPYIYTSAAREIGDEAFANTGIERLFLSKNITKLGDRVFSGLSLETIIFETGSNIEFSAGTFENIAASNSAMNRIDIYYNPDDYGNPEPGFIDKYVDIVNPIDLCYNSIHNHTFLVLYPEFNSFEKYWIKIEESSLTTISADDIETTIVSSSKPSISAPEVREVLFSRDIITVGANSFSLFQNLRILDFTGNVALTTIGDSAFQGCSSIRKVIFPYTIMSIGERAFQGCSRLEFLYFPIYSSGDMVCGAESFYGVAPVLTINYECTGGMTEMNKISASFTAANNTSVNFLFTMNAVQPDY